ncbi:hypothetical protein [Caldisphaera lagunensis]
MKKALELEEGIEISDSEVYNYLTQLVNYPALTDGASPPRGRIS